MNSTSKFSCPWKPLLLAMLIVAIGSACVFACPTCKEGIDQNDPHHQSLARGFYYSILFMMTMPFAILGTFGSMAYISIKRAKARQLADAIGA